MQQTARILCWFTTRSGASRNYF